jgi:hypothetical protein
MRQWFCLVNLVEAVKKMVGTHLHYYTAICQERLRHHNSSQSGWLVTKLLFKEGAQKLHVRNITTFASSLIDIRQVFGTSKVLFVFLTLHLRSVASLISQPCSWILLEYYKLKDIHLDCVGKEDIFNIALTHHISSAHIWVLKPPGLYQPLDNLNLTHSAE